MTIRQNAYIFLLAAPLACCSVDASKVRILCVSGSPEQQCLEGQTCGPLGECVALDGGVIEPPADQSLTDQTGSTPDLTTTSSGCANQGGEKMGNAWGCLGTFNQGDALKLCRTGLRLCVSSSPVNAPLCGKSSKLYLAEVSGYWTNTMNQESCGIGGTNHILFGCGPGRASILQCGGFPIVVDVKGSITSADGSLANAKNTDPNQGVLCCP